MPLPIINDVFRVTFNWLAGSMRANNVMHFLSTTLTPAQVLTQIDTNVTANMWAPTSTGATVASIEALKLDGTTAAATLVTTGAKWTGATAGEFVPSGAMCVTLYTAVRGRRNRGRVYVPFVAEANNVSGVLLGTNLALAQSAWETFRAAMATANVGIVVASYVQPGAHSNGVTRVVAQNIMATQRRRQSQLRV